MRHLMTILALFVMVCAVVSIAAPSLPSLYPVSDQPRSEREYHQALLNVQASLAASDEVTFTRTGRMDKQIIRYSADLDEASTEQDHTDQAHGPG